MEPQESFKEFLYGRRCINLKWNSLTTSEEIVIDAIESIGKIVLKHFKATFINFLVSNNQSPEGEIVSIDTIVLKNIPVIYIQAPDAKKNRSQRFFVPKNDQNINKFPMVFEKKQTFVIKNCKITEEKSEILEETEIIKHPISLKTTKKFEKIKKIESLQEIEKIENLSQIENFQEIKKIESFPRIEKLENTKKPEKIENSRIITQTELAKHWKKNDCWISYEGKVYDISDYTSRHPGGSIIMKAAGRDASDFIKQYHPWVNVSMLISHMKIGVLSNQ